MPQNKSSKRLFLKFIGPVITGLLLIVVFFFIYPDISELKKENPRKTSFMKYREDEWKKQGRKILIQQIWTPLSRISPYLSKAVLIAEDDKFYTHEGFDYESIKKAIEKNIEQKKFKFGGSTISQ